MLRRLFEREVEYLWSRLAVASRGRESLAPLWSRDGDPRIVRIVESAAYVFARVREKLEDDVPEISHSLISCALPEALRPTPSATIVQLRDPARERRDVVEQHIPPIDTPPIEGAPCTFNACWPITTGPVALERATLRLLEAGVQTLTLRLGAYPGMELPAALPDSLRVFVHTRDPVHAIDLVRALHATREAPRARSLDERGVELRAIALPGVSVRWTALESPLRVSGARYDRFASGTALRALFSFPELFGFFDVVGLHALRGSGLGTRVVELTFQLERPVRPELSEARVELDCAPALNVFPGTATLDVGTLGSCGTIGISGRPGAEVFVIQDVRLAPDGDPDRTVPVRLWEEQGPPHAYDDDALYLRLERRGLPGEGVELRPWLVRPRGSHGVPKSRLRVALLATDGHRTEGLGAGYLSLEGDGFRLSNITRVTPPWSCVLGERIPWRLNAYARMSVLQFACRRSLNAYLLLHDPSRASSAAAAGGSGVVAVTRQRVRRVVGTEVHHGDQVDIELDEDALGGPGATWLVGKFLAGALAERADLLRYTRTRWVTHDGRVEADYGIRGGERLPPPFG